MRVCVCCVYGERVTDIANGAKCQLVHIGEGYTGTYCTLLLIFLEIKIFFI